MRSTFKVLFYLKRDTKKQQKVVPVMGRITINGTIAQFSAKISVPVALWEVKGCRAKGKSLEADRINRHLDNIRGQVNNHYLSICDRETLVTAVKVRNAYLGLEQKHKSLMGTFDAYIVALEQRIGVDRSKSTLLSYRATAKHLRFFLQDKYHVSDIALIELEASFIELFHVYLQTECNLKPISACRYLACLLKVVKTAFNDGFMPRNPFASYTYTASSPERIFLTEEELRRLQTTPLRKGLHFVRDMFLFSCFTGICHADMRALTWKQFEQNETGAWWIMGRRVKTKTLYVVKLLSTPLSILVAPQAADIRLQSVCFYNVPRKSAPFGPSVPASTAAGYTTAGCAAIPDAEASRFSGVVYLPENLQGTVSSITDQRQKIARNAPPHATYMLIRALRGERVLDYAVYLGENNTDNFDVRRNTCHTLDITIRGDEEIDTCVHGFTLSVWDDLGDDTWGGYTVVDPQRGIHVLVEGNDPAYDLHGEVEITSGDSRNVCFDRMTCGARHEFDLYEPQGRNYFELAYQPEVITTENDYLEYSVTLMDDYGYEKTWTFKHRFANEVIAYVNNSGSRVTVAEALHHQQMTGSRNLRVLCSEKGCTFTAEPAAGYRFDGWYADAACSRLLSADAQYRYVPTSCYAPLFPKFVESLRNLSAEGTANCYIAPALGAAYCFDARVRGNGKSTTNISAAPLTGGVKARVLWEMGPDTGRVIRSAEYVEGEIRFVTGDRYGNALIGLFDDADRCIWSWHIWVAAYDPAQSAQAYSAGVVVMDRNIGAMSAWDKGLYYQWGRKDPFHSDWQQVVYHADYPYDVTDPIMGYGEMTLDYATAHPWAFLCGIYYNDDRNENIRDWLAAPNPNLWGNPSGAYTLAEGGGKSIYDPCPPGWRVPDRRTFDKAGMQVIATQSGSCDVRIAGGVARYPRAGFLSEGNPALNDNTAWVWTNAPAVYGAGPQYYKYYATALHIASGVVEPLSLSSRDNALPVRCIRE